MYLDCAHLIYRCTAASNNLDDKGGQRQHSHTERLFQAMDAWELWYNYGVIDDIMVCKCLSDIFSILMTKIIQPFMHYFP